MKDGNNDIKAYDRKIILPAAALVMVLICVVTALSGNGRNTDEQAAAKLPRDDAVVISKGESLVIPVAEINDEAKFYPIIVDGADMEVLAVRASDGTIRTAFNTCQSCYTSGAGFYSFEKGELVCNNCGFRFSPDEVEIASGGCNPWPIFEENKTVSDDSIAIPYDFLAESKEIFANWKTAVH